MKKILFLYTEIADYFVSCCEYLAKDYEITIIRWPINKEAPFELKNKNRLKIVENNNNWPQLESSLIEQEFDLIVVSGWIDKDYLKFTKRQRKKGVKTVLTLDNHWTGSVKQNIAKALAPFTLRKTFTHVWVPGKPQKLYAEKLGFPSLNIFENFYCANEELFLPNYEKGQNTKYHPLKKRFIYVGRYMEHKGIFDLWSAYAKFRETNKEWELWCVGIGVDWDRRIEGEGIKHLGFIQPEKLGDILNETTVFILPSHFEPWGVVVHENALSGFPMILSDQIGAHTKFLVEGENGYKYKAGDVQDLYLKMKKIAELGDDELKTMGQNSHQLGISLGFKKWSEVPRKILGDI